MTTTSAEAQAEPLAWDPLNEKYKADPHPIWKRLRDEAPLYYNEELDFYAVSRFADVDAFSRDPKTFCSSHGTVLEMITAEKADIEMMIFMDPPEHTATGASSPRPSRPGAWPRSRRTSGPCAPGFSTSRTERVSSTTCRTSGRRSPPT